MPRARRSRIAWCRPAASWAERWGAQRHKAPSGRSAPTQGVSPSHAASATRTALASHRNPTLHMRRDAPRRRRADDMLGRRLGQVRGERGERGRAGWVGSLARARLPALGHLMHVPLHKRMRCELAATPAPPTTLANATATATGTANHARLPPSPAPPHTSPARACPASLLPAPLLPARLLPTLLSRAPLVRYEGGRPCSWAPRISRRSSRSLPRATPPHALTSQSHESRRY